MAPNSDSTVTNSHRFRSPAATSSAMPSTLWVCGELGYAGPTCGRHRATASATARDPSICLSTAGLPPGGPDDVVGRFRGGDVAAGHRLREALTDGGQHRVQRHRPG